MKNRVKALLTVLGLSVIMMNANEITAYATGQTKVNLDLDGGQLQSDYDLQLIHREINGIEEDSGSWTEYADYFSVEQIRELGNPTKTNYAFLGWHGSSEVYTTENSDVTPIEIYYKGYYDNWDADDIAYSPRLVDENNNLLDEITLTAVYIPTLIIDAGDYVLGCDPNLDMCDTSKYVYYVEKELLPEKDGMTGFLEIISDDPERNGEQVELDNYIEMFPGETVKLVYKPSVPETVNDNMTEEVEENTTDDILSEPTEKDVDATAIGKFTEVQKMITIAVVVFLGLFILPLLIAYIICRILTKVEVQNNKNTDDYMDNNFETVQKGNIEVEGNIGIYLTKLLDKNNTEVWKYTISDETLNNRVSDEFKLVLTKNFVKKFNGQQLIVKIGNGENAKTQGFTIDEQETEIKLVMEITD